MTLNLEGLETHGEGWGRPQSADKPHYFVNGDALCGRWQYRGDIGIVLDDPRLNARTYADRLDGCKACRKQLRGRMMRKVPA